MGTKTNPGRFDCYEKADPDEPMFILLGRDSLAATLVRLWALGRHRAIERGQKPAEDASKVTEALQCADAMDAYTKKLGRWVSDNMVTLLPATRGLKKHPQGYQGLCNCDACLAEARALAGLYNADSLSRYAPADEISAPAGGGSTDSTPAQ